MARDGLITLAGQSLQEWEYEHMSEGGFEQQLFKSQPEERIENVSSNPEYQRLVPGYKEYIQHESIAEEPLVHGTGSYALRRIIERGFIPQQGHDVLQGEKVAYGDTTEENELIPISFAKKSPLADKISHLYATWPASELSLSFNSEVELGDSRVDRVAHDVYGGLKASIERRLQKEVASRPDRYETDEYLTREQKIELSRLEMKKELEHKFLDRSQAGVNTFNPQRMKERREKFNATLAGLVTPEEAEQVLRDTYVLQQARYYYAPKGDTVPLYQMREVMSRLLTDVQDTTSMVGQVAQRALQKLDTKITAYDKLSEEEKAELEHQFLVLLRLRAKVCQLAQ